jgi:hypothetical protein
VVKSRVAKKHVFGGAGMVAPREICYAVMPLALFHGVKGWAKLYSQFSCLKVSHCLVSHLKRRKEKGERENNFGSRIFDFGFFTFILGFSMINAICHKSAIRIPQSEFLQHCPVSHMKRRKEKERIISDFGFSISAILLLI